MKKVWSTLTFFVVILVALIPYVFLAEYVTEINELESQLKTAQYLLEVNQQDLRLLKQDVEILNNIVFEKDFVKRLD